MKKISILAICCVIFLLQGCLKDKFTHTYTLLVPVYKDKAAVYANIKSNAPVEIQSPGKIFIYGKYIFLNEIDKGIHVIDNSNPALPVEKAFIDIPGNLDIAVKGTTLYADMYGDLVTIDISDPLQAKLVKYIPDIFPERSYSNGFVADRNRGVIVGWIKKDTTVQLEGSADKILNTGILLNFQAASAPTANGIPSAPGIAGSMARFSLVNDYLYVVDHHTLKSLSLANAFEPVMVSSINAGWDIETIYPFKNKLFLGSMGGMFVFDISNPALPEKESDFVHARACDPVIADDNYALITLRAGTSCGPANNELQIVDISNIMSPVLFKTYSMTSPHGLAKDENLLFICDGEDGLKVYDASNLSNIILKKHFTGLETYDAIAWNNNLIVVAKDGLYQYDYSNPDNLVQKSKLSLNR